MAVSPTSVGSSVTTIVTPEKTPRRSLTDNDSDISAAARASLSSFGSSDDKVSVTHVVTPPPTVPGALKVGYVVIPMGEKARIIPLHALADAERTVTDMYAGFDLASLPLFKGGLINFGYWKGISLEGVLTDEDRVKSERNLYHKLVADLHICSEDVVLEVGCGLGYGCNIISTDYHPKSVTGLDFSEAQLARARTRQADLLSIGKVRFVQGPAESMPLEDNKYTKVISVEAAQHFRDIHSFIREARRVLQSGGKLAVTTFFAKTEASISELAAYIPSIKDKVDNVVSITDAIRMLEAEGFVEIQCCSIGADVWPGYDKWIQQTELRDSWNKNWLTVHREGHLDYYMITATKA